ncbi:hypothetical protein AB1Y20_013354 [Prymnesium parvum]|uniref:Fatty acid hydroxylase domain-containing protein n=1 Tax=Prymnesium parvum TaxID=97485 RepID=A0AB34ILW9_PRYPA
MQFPLHDPVPRLLAQLCPFVQLLMPLLAAVMDAHTLRLMFFPGGQSSKVFCFGEEREKGFRFSNYVISLSFLWGMLHVLSLDGVLPSALVLRHSELPAIVAFLSFTYLCSFFALAVEHNARKRASAPSARHAWLKLLLPLLYYLVECGTFLSHAPALLPTIICATLVLSASVAAHDMRAPVDALTGAQLLLPALVTLANSLIIFTCQTAGVSMATSLTLLLGVYAYSNSVARVLRRTLGRLAALVPPPLLPACGRGGGGEACDGAGVPLKYYDCGACRLNESAPRAHALAHSVRFCVTVTAAGLAGRGEVLSSALLVLRSLGVDAPGALEAASGHGLWVALYLLLSFVLAAYGYYAHCSAIEAWCDAQPAGTEEAWKLQPHRHASAESRRLSMRLGTFNAGCAAVYGTATTLLHLHGGYGTRLYFAIADYGMLWYLASWPIFFAWVELFAYTFHAFFHLKFIYKHFHKLHHYFQPPTAFSAVAFHPFEFACYVLGGQLIFFVLPVHPTVMLSVGLYTAYHLVEDHTGIKATPSWPWQPTSAFHDDHHRYFHCNFGQHVLWYDWLFGTLRNVGRSYGEEVFGGKGLAARAKAM